jgi:hypothetical protein
VGVPVVLDVIVGSLRKVRSYGCPSAYIHVVQRLLVVNHHGRHGRIDEQGMCVPVS